MRAPYAAAAPQPPSEPKSTFPTYQVPRTSAMRGGAPPAAVQVARAAGGGRAAARASPPRVDRPLAGAAVVPPSVISGSSCHSSTIGNSNLRMQSVTENCLLNSVTVPKIQRIDHGMVAHNNSFKLVSKFGALKLLLPHDGLHIPNQKSEDLEDDEGPLDNDLKVLNSDGSDNDARRGDGEERLEPPLRLRGGGESSLSTGTSGWGTPPSQQTNSNNANGNKTNGQQQPPAGQQGNSGWGQPGGGAGGGKAPSNGALPPPAAGQQQPPAAAPASGAAAAQSNGPTTSNTKQQLEQLNSMREAIFSQDGWGGQHVNQDTNWDVPSSPEPPIKMDGTGGPPPWKPSVNNGTELWEANLRNGGQPPPQPQQKTPWGHTPSTNIGGTWGEDDDTSADSSNVWTGVPPAGVNQPPQWGGGQGQGVGGGSANNGAMWGGPKKENDWGGAPNAGGWGDPRQSNDPRQGGGMEHARGGVVGPTDMRAANSDAMRLLDAREQMRQMGGGGDMRGDPRGITGRLNGAGAEAFWGGQQGGGPQQHGGAQPMHHHNKMAVAPGGAGWEEPSPPSQRRNVPNYDDGTSLWGNPQQGSHGGSHWKDLPSGNTMGRGGVGGGLGNAGVGPPGMAQQSRMKPDAGVGGVWGGGGGGQQQHGRNGSWDDGGGVGPGGGGGGWDDPLSWAKQKMAGPLWGDENDWGGGGGGGLHKPPSKAHLPKEIVWNSKPFRMLVDMGYKKEDVENALRMREMNYEEALELLSPMRNARDLGGWSGGGGMGGGNRHDDHYDHPPFNCQRYPPSGPNLGGGGGFQPGGGGPNLSGAGGNSLINNISPAVVQKMFTQGGGGGGGGGGQPGFGSGGGGRSMQPQSQPSTHQLRMLVQQIQMAVQAGYLNHQILNQPLAPQTLVLLNQLLQQIKTLQQLNAQQSLATSHPINGKPSNAYLQCSVMITKTKQTIANLQNQIAAQQATYVKQQLHQSSMSAYDSFKPNSMHDSINSLQTNFADIGINKDPQLNQQQSRLTQWINTKEKEDGGEFSRAPGTSSKPMTTSPNMNPLGLNPSDGPWSSGRSGDNGWPDSGGGDNSNDVKDGQWSTAPQPSLTDLVPEFEPGKPWKGNQMKSIEDDPSITPGSVVRSPLSIATIKDNELFSMNPAKSPPASAAASAASDAIQSLSLGGSSTWSFNPSAVTAVSAFTSPPSGKLPSSKVGLDLGQSGTASSELWGAPKASRGPPPGLSTKGSGGGNSWAGNAMSWGGGGGNQRGSSGWGGSSQWLLLRNLTAQIDGSTLRTLCMQHGPLQSFHLYLHQGFALAKYSSREEAVKAQTALNNCVLGNTTILAENPTDWDANTLLQQVAASQQSGSSGAWRSAAAPKQPPPQPGAADAWSAGAGWPAQPAANLWAAPPLDGGDASRGTPSSLNSFLPNDLLGGESM